MMLNNWFEEKRGLVMGIVYSSSAAGGFIFSPLVNWLIARFGWQESYLFLGILVAVTAVPISIFVMRARPGDVGLRPYGSSIEDSSAPRGESGLSLGESVRTASFWLLGGMPFFLSVVSLGVQQHIIPYLTDIGHTPGFGAAMLALFMGMLVIGKIALGALSDALGLKKAVLVIFLVYALTVATLFRRALRGGGRRLRPSLRLFQRGAHGAPAAAHRRVPGAEALRASLRHHEHLHYARFGRRHAAVRVHLRLERQLFPRVRALHRLHAALHSARHDRTFPTPLRRS